jgi:hypothetical protein
MSEENTCISCRQPKVITSCEVCSEALCRRCVQTLSADAFSFLAVVPEILQHQKYCGACFDEHVAPEMLAYQETMEAAKGVFIFFKTQRRGIPLLKGSKEIVRVPECMDRDETILRLAFFAAKEGYNAVTDVDVVSDKTREGKGSYQHIKWRGTGYPGMVDAARMDLRDLQEQMYR